jgi:lysophospholipase L1-like esterase
MRKILLFLIISVIVNILLAGIFAYKYYHNWFESGVLKSPFRESIFNAAPNDTGKIHFVGDSHTEAFELNELLHNADTRNRGVWGDRSDNVLKRLNSVIVHKPRKIFLLIGVNDICAGKSVQSVLNNVDKIIKKSKGLVPGVRIYLESLLPTNTPILHSTEKTIDKLKLVNEGFKTIAAKHSIQYIDLFPYFVEGDGLKAAYSSDGLHLNGTGYIKLAGLLKPYVDE